MTKRILVAFDGTPQSTKALEFATEEWGDHDLTLLYVINPVEAGFSGGGVPSAAEEWYDTAKAEAEELLAEANADHGGGLSTHIEVGKPAKAIVEAAEGDIDDEDDEPAFDHVVIGSHGRKGVSRMLLGSVAEKVVRDSPVPVTVVR